MTNNLIENDSNAKAQPTRHCISFTHCTGLVAHHIKGLNSSGRGWTADGPCNWGDELPTQCLFVSLLPPPQGGDILSFFFSFLTIVSHYSLSILNVSSVAGSVSTISGSLSMCRPSRVSGSIFSSSNGN